MSFGIKSLIYAVATYVLQFHGVLSVDAVAGSDNINGVYAVYTNQHYANCTSIFCTGPNWGTNGE